MQTVHINPTAALLANVHMTRPQYQQAVKQSAHWTPVPASSITPLPYGGLPPDDRFHPGSPYPPSSGQPYSQELLPAQHPFVQALLALLQRPPVSWSWAVPPR